MAVINQKPNMNQGLWAESGNVETPSSDKIGLGWVVEKPLNVQMNWVQNRQDTMLQYLNQRGVPEWDSLTDYPTNAYVSRGGVLYNAISQNKDKDPTKNTAIWAISFTPYQTGVTLTSEVSKIKSQDGYLSQYVQKSSPYMNNHCRGVSYGTQINNNFGLFFTSSGFPELRGGGYYSFNGTSTNSNDVLRRMDLDAIIKEALKYKVGDIYLTTSTQNPSAILGYGTWSRFAQGRALVGVSDSASAPDWTRISGNNYGSYTHILSVDEMPRHNHTLSDASGTEGGGISADLNNNQGGATGSAIGYSGGGQAHNNVQPSSVVSIWQRVD